MDNGEIAKITECFGFQRLPDVCLFCQCNNGCLMSILMIAECPVRYNCLATTAPQLPEFCLSFINGAAKVVCHRGRGGGSKHHSRTLLFNFLSSKEIFWISETLLIFICLGSEIQL